PVSPADFAERLAGCGAGDSVRLPDGRTAEVLSTAPERGGAWQAVCTRVRTADGQSLRFRHSPRKAPAAPAGRSGGPPAAELRGAHLPVRSLGRVAAVLEELFGLYPAQRGGSWAAYGGLILTEAPPPAEEAPGRQEDRPEGSSPRAVAGDGRKDERPAEAPLRAVAGDGREPTQLRLSTADGSAALDRARASAWSEAVEETADGFIVRADPWLTVHGPCPPRPRRRTSRSCPPGPSAGDGKHRSPLIPASSPARPAITRSGHRSGRPARGGSHAPGGGPGRSGPAPTPLILAISTGPGRFICAGERCWTGRGLQDQPPHGVPPRRSRRR